MIKYARLIGGNTDLLTAQAFYFSQEVDGVKVYCACLLSAVGEDAFTKVRVVGLSLPDKFLELPTSVSESTPAIQHFIEESLGDLENLQFIVVQIRGSALSLFSQGKHLIYLSRNNKISLLTNGHQLSLAGQLQEGDKLLLLSSYQIESKEDSSDGWHDRVVEDLIKLPPDLFEQGAEEVLKKQTENPFAMILIESQEAAEPAPTHVHFLEEEQQQPQTIPSIEKPLTKRNIFPKLRFNKRVFYPFLGFIVLFSLLSVGVFLYQRSQSSSNAQVQSMLELARTKYAQAQSLKDTDPLSAQKALDEAKAEVNRALRLNAGSSEAKKLKEEIDKNTNAILKVAEVVDWPLFLSLDLIKSDFHASRLSFSLGKVALLDEQKKTLVVVDLASKKPTILAGAVQLGDAQYASINGSDIYVYSKDKGILHVDSITNKVSQVVKPDSEWGNIVDLYAFAGNLYLLDEFKNQIWKYVPIEAGFTPKQPYIKDNAQLQFAGVKRLQVDYSVWVIKPGPELFKFTGGYEDDFSVGGIEEPIKDTVLFFPVEDVDKLYIMDPQNKRAVILKKTGEYVGQIKGEKFANMQDFIVDEESKKMFVLEGNKLYQISL